MRREVRNPIVVAAIAWASAAPGASGPGRPAAPSSERPAAAARPGDAPSGPVCAGDYADEFSALSSHAREFERNPENRYSYCLRTTASYECLSYATDGSIRRARRTAVAHGTAFAYRRGGGETFLLTNQHVAEWPAVTDDDHRVDEVPPGCKLVGETLKIVDDEKDDYEGNDIALTRVVSDPTLDAAVLKTRTALKLIPYRIGQSRSLHVGNGVTVRGFPLGAFAATNFGKVVNAYDHDTEGDWDHVDFVVDALLSPGSSGSPVLAISCKTGEYELVGLYHAGYVRGSALNVVVGIDQLRDLMTTLRRSQRSLEASQVGAGAADRAMLQEALAAPGFSPFFPFGPLVAVSRILPSGGLAFEVYSRGFPLRDERLLVIEDLPAAKGFGEVGRIYLGNGRGLRALERAVLDADAQAQLDRIMARLRAAAVGATRFRGTDPSSSKGHRRRQAVERELSRQATTDRETAQALIDLSDRLGPKAGERAVAYRDAFRDAPVPRPAVPVAGRPR